MRRGTPARKAGSKASNAARFRVWTILGLSRFKVEYSRHKANESHPGRFRISTISISSRRMRCSKSVLRSMQMTTCRNRSSGITLSKLTRPFSRPPKSSLKMTCAISKRALPLNVCYLCSTHASLGRLKQICAPFVKSLYWTVNKMSIMLDRKIISIS